MEQGYLEQLFGLQDRVVIITGGGGVLGGAMARGLARAGARVVVLGRTLERLQVVVGEINAAGGQALAVQGDVLDRASLEAALATVLEHYGRVDGLINAAGGNRPEATTSADSLFFDLPQEAIAQVFSLNWMGTLLPIQVFGREMVGRGEGAIINVASVNAFRPLTNVVAYSAAKSAVKNLTEWLAVHVAQNYAPDIRVNAIAPGFFLTAQNEYLLIDDVTGGATARGEQIIAHTPMGRYGNPEELISTVIWLLSPGASFVSGVTVLVDGGYCAFGGV
ncbi:MAG: SDR family oxidoreductase [Anaerolineae bacterium]|jgi:NAD(P)-dependent dehydrogenase (short-subunit alcohol dehydrogenase family)